MVMFKVYNNLLPENIQNFFLQRVSGHCLTISNGQFSYQYARTILNLNMFLSLVLNFGID